MDINSYKVLFKIKKIDDEVRLLESKKKKNPSYLLDLREVVKQKKAQVIEKETLLKLEEDKLNTIESVIEENKDKLKKSQEKLSQVNNAKEYHMVNKEISSLEKNIANLEGQKEKQNQIITSTKEEISKLSENLNKIAMDYEAAVVNFKDDVNLIERDLQDLKNDKEDFFKELSKPVVDSYRKVSDRKRNSAISVIKEGKCTGCNMSLPPQFCNEIIKADELKLCPSCQRIVIKLEENSK